MVVGIAAVGTGLDRQRRQDRTRQTARTQTLGFETLVAARHAISDIRFGNGGAIVGVFGSRSGNYRLRWSIREQTYRKTLIDGVIRVE